jgi:hypothetical protein
VEYESSTLRVEGRLTVAVRTGSWDETKAALRKLQYEEFHDLVLFVTSWLGTLCHL